MKTLCWLLTALLFCLPPPAPTPSVRSVENAGLLFTDNQAGVSGVDAGYSLPIGGRTLWLFGDVFLLHPSDPRKPYVGGLSNAGLLVPAGRGARPLRENRFLVDERGIARAAIPNRPGEGNEIRLWPLGGSYDSRSRRAYLFYGRILTTGTGMWDFRLQGHGLASSTVADPNAIRFERIPAAGGGELWWNAPAPVFGAAVIADAPGEWIYVVGIDERAGRKQGLLARVRKDRIARSGAYEYLSGQTGKRSWSSNLAEAADLEGIQGSSEMSVAFNPYLGGWLAVQSAGLTERIKLSVAPRPWGPYRLLAEIGAPHRAFEKAVCYAGKEHPELREKEGQIVYVTYVDSQRYWLQLLKVTFQK